jgi:hypothetical protein
MELLRSEEFTVHRVIVARITAEAYVRQFWWFILPGPLFGILLLIFFHEPMIQAFGALGCVWPLTIPFRAYLLTFGLGKRMSKPTTLLVMEEGLFFQNPDGGFKIRFGALRNAYIRHGMLILNSKRFSVLLIPVTAFSGEGGKNKFLKLLEEHGVRVNQKSFLEI